jgi:hypothetical protein
MIASQVALVVANTRRHKDDLLFDASGRVVGQKYLIQHLAGKSNSIA